MSHRFFGFPHQNYTQLSALTISTPFQLRKKKKKKKKKNELANLCAREYIKTKISSYKNIKFLLGCPGIALNCA